MAESAGFMDHDAQRIGVCKGERNQFQITSQSQLGSPAHQRMGKTGSSRVATPHSLFQRDFEREFENSRNTRTRLEQVGDSSLQPSPRWEKDGIKVIIRSSPNKTPTLNPAACGCLRLPSNLRAPCVQLSEMQS
jgi:hypothetical protein